MKLFLQPRLNAADSSHVRMLIKGYANNQCGETPTDLRMGVPAPVINVVGLRATFIEMQRKAAITATYMSGRDARKLEYWLKMQP
jgi:hypothetical protein